MQAAPKRKKFRIHMLSSYNIYNTGTGQCIYTRKFIQARTFIQCLIRSTICIHHSRRLHLSMRLTGSTTSVLRDCILGRRGLPSCKDKVLNIFHISHMARARGIEVVLGDFCQGDSGSRTVRAMGAKLGVRIAIEIGFHQ